jgi:uncharacterized protein (DUF1330 family)
VKVAFREDYEEHSADYSLKAGTYLDRDDAEVIRRQRVNRSLYGSETVGLIMIIDCSSMEIAARIFFQPKYLALMLSRDKVFRLQHVCCGVRRSLTIRCTDRTDPVLRLNGVVICSNKYGDEYENHELQATWWCL